MRLKEVLADRTQLRNLDESFVVLPGSASVQRQAQAPQTASQQGSSPGWSSLIQQLTRAFEVATTETKASSCLLLIIMHYWDLLPPVSEAK